MHIAFRSNKKQQRYWYKALHLFYAGLYAFVLPLICWGAQATPGHPHARAHFVFTDPPLQVDLALHAAQVVKTVEGWLSVNGNQTLCTTHHASTTPQPIDLPQLPAGRSVPSQLAIGAFIPIGAVTSLLPPNADRAGFSIWLAESIVPPFHTTVDTPPPR